MKALFAPAGGGAWGPDHHGHVRERLGRSATWAILGEDLPEEANRVELSTTLADASGLAAPKISYRVSSNTVALSKWNIARASESLQQAGAWKVEVVERLANGHFMGTARMGDDPAISVVDQWCVAHDTPNLLIVDGSVFVTSGAANPTSTIGALALRAADRLVQARAAMPRPRRSRSFGLIGAAEPESVDQARETLQVVTRQEAIDGALRTRFERVAEWLIPRVDEMPGAAEVNVGGDLLDRVLRVRPDLVDPLKDFLSRFNEDEVPESVVFQGAEGRAVRYAAAAAYYLDDRVRDRLGYPGAVARPVARFSYPEYLVEGLLDHLITT
jgi:hypothetical protein